MSKEQTPIEELLSDVRQMIKRTSSPTAISELKVVEILIRDIYFKKEKQYANAKVLETLESRDTFKIDASRLSHKEKIQFMSYIQNVSIKCDITKQK